jgi:integrase
LSRKRDYLFKRPGSQFWRIRLQSNGRSVERSLKTGDRAEAEVLALPFISEHKQQLLQARPRLQTGFAHKLAPGQTHETPDGRVLASDETLFFLDGSGAIVRQEPNRIATTELVNARLFSADLPALQVHRMFDALAPKDRPTVATKNGDDELFEAYVKHAGLSGYPEREARTVWGTFKQLIGKPLRECTREDGRKVAAHYKDQGLKVASVRKKIMWLCSTVNFAINEGEPWNLLFNPFKSVAPKKGDDSIRRKPLNDEDMALCLRNLDKLTPPHQLLFRLLASTGMRLGEAFQIEEEHTERGCRYVIVGTKTEQSERRVPLPTSVLPYLPKKIEGKLFAGDSNSASRRLNPWLREIGITDAAKVIHSLRHRAQDQLRAAGCPQDIREALLGHEKKTVAAGYGAGFPVTMLREWIDKVLPLTTAGKGPKPGSKLAA